jgi:hypothetical protein
MYQLSPNIARATTSVDNDFDAAHVDVLHAAGVLGLVYSALEHGDLVAEGRLDAGTVSAAIRAAIIASERAALVLNAATAGGRS